MADRVIDRPVGWLLLRSIVAIVSIVVGASIVGSGAWMNLSTVVIVTSSVSFPTLSVPRVMTTSMLFWRSKENRVVGVGLYMLL